MTPHEAAPTRIGQITAVTSAGASASPRPAVALIAAVASNGVIGAANRLPWRLAEDLRRFRALTTGHAVIMGRKTWESLARALPERQNIVVSRRRGYTAEGAETADTFSSALARVRLPAPAFCIGGGELYRVALPFATVLHMTGIAREFEGDTRFPAFERGDWRETAREHHPASAAEGFAWAYVTYERETPAVPVPDPR